MNFEISSQKWTERRGRALSLLYKIVIVLILFYWDTWRLERVIIFCVALKKYHFKKSLMLLWNVILLVDVFSGPVSVSKKIGLCARLYRVLQAFFLFFFARLRVGSGATTKRLFQQTKKMEKTVIKNKGITCKIADISSLISQCGNGQIHLRFSLFPASSPWHFLLLWMTPYGQDRPPLLLPA